MASSEIDRLLKPAGSRRLKPAAKRDPIPRSESVVIPQDTSERGTSIASPLTETGSTGTKQFASSDGLFVLEYPDETQYDDDNGEEVIFKHL